MNVYLFTMHVHVQERTNDLIGRKRNAEAVQKADMEANGQRTGSFRCNGAGGAFSSPRPVLERTLQTRPTALHHDDLLPH